MVEVLEAGEAFGAEEALVPHVVEVLDDPVAPGLAQWDEAGHHVEVQAGGHHRPEMGPGRGDPTSKVGVVVELGHGGHTGGRPTSAPSLRPPSWGGGR